MLGSVTVLPPQTRLLPAAVDLSGNETLDVPLRLLDGSNQFRFLQASGLDAAFLGKGLNLFHFYNKTS
jgi:hypothetical protein